MFKRLIWLLFLPFVFGFTNIAHRGDNELGKYSEHSYQAYDHALASGADYLELDLQKTHDNILVVSHDDNLGRVFGVDQNINHSNFANLRKVKNKSGEPIHSLTEVISRYKSDPKIKFMIETKDGQAQMEQRLVSLIKKNHLEKRVLFESFSLASLAKLAKLAPEIPRTQLGGDYHNVGDNQYYSDGFYDPKAAKFLAKHEKGYIVWGADTKKQMTRLIGHHVDGIITDFPDRLNKLVGCKNMLPVRKISGKMTVSKPFALVKNGWQILPKNSQVDVNYVIMKNGQLYYGISNNEWINEQDLTAMNRDAPRTKQGQVFLKHSAPLWRDPAADKSLGRNLRANSKWNYYAVSDVNGRKFYNLGGNQWLDGRDVEKVV